MKTFIFDLDGTLANINNRLHFIKCDKPDWSSFFKACVDDVPIQQTIDILNCLSKEFRIIISSGRSDVVAHETRQWLDLNQVRYHSILMRNDGDHRPDDELKRYWLDNGFFGRVEDIVGVFDDRKRVVDMWRRNGLICYNVADGDY